VIALSLGSLAPVLVAAAPGTLALTATTAPGAPVLLVGLLTILSSLG